MLTYLLHLFLHGLISWNTYKSQFLCGHSVQPITLESWQDDFLCIFISTG
jgi:hypothetical protein